MSEIENSLNAVLEDNLPLEQERGVVEAAVKKHPEIAAALVGVLLNQKHQHKRAYHELRQEAEQLPQLVATYRGASRIGGKPRALVVAAQREISVAVAAGVELEQLEFGCRVLLSAQNVLLGEAPPGQARGEIATVSEIVELQVRLNGASGDDRLYDVAGPLLGELVEGQEVVYDREAQMVLEKLPINSHHFEVLQEMHPGITIDDLGGLDDTFASLVDDVTLPLLRPDLMSRYHLRPVKGIVFSGPPGVGKTSMVQALQDYLHRTQGINVRCLALPPGGHRSKWFGDAEKLVGRSFAEAIRTAKSPNTVVFFVLDDFDHLGSRDDSAANVHDARLIPCFLHAIDALDPARDRVMLFGITNREDLLDAALLRRFSERVYSFPRPGRAATRQILEKLLPRDLPGMVNGHDLRGGIVERLLGALFSANGEHRALATLVFRDNTRQDVLAGDVLSGAVLANVVAAAKQSSALREHRGGPGCVGVEDLLAALDRSLNQIAARLTPGPALYQTLNIPRDRDVVHVEVHPARRAPKSDAFTANYAISQSGVNLC
jgi:proteasome-associated ATPase